MQSGAITSREFELGAGAALVAALLGACAGFAPRVEAPSVVVSRIELTSDVAVDSMGADFPTIDGACRTAGFSSAGEIYVTDLVNPTFRRVTLDAAGGPANQRSGIPKLSADATRIAFVLDSRASAGRHLGATRGGRS